MSKLRLLISSRRELIKGKTFIWSALSFFLTTSLGVGVQEVVKLIAKVIWYVISRLF